MVSSLDFVFVFISLSHLIFFFFKAGTVKEENKGSVKYLVQVHTADKGQSVLAPRSADTAHALQPEIRRATA